MSDEQPAPLGEPLPRDPTEHHNGGGAPPGAGGGQPPGESPPIQAEPPLEAYGDAASWYFLNQPEWIERHVETLDILSGRTAANRLTIDLRLPEAPDTWLCHPDGKPLTCEQGVRYCLPIARLSKDRPTSFIDLQDEEGRTLPLLTRGASATISRRALKAAVNELLQPNTMDPALSRWLDVLVEEEWLLAAFAAGTYRRAQEIFEPLATGPRAERVAQVVHQLQANSFVWVALDGAPRTPRVLQLGYRIPLDPPTIPVRKRVLLGSLQIEGDGPVDMLETTRAVVSRLTAAVGWDAIDLRVPHPVTEDSGSYHFQVRSPTGLQVSEIVLPDGKPRGDAVRVHRGPGHLYVHGAERGQRVRLLLRMRVQRRGLLNVSMLTSLLITALMWCVYFKRGAVLGGGNETHAQIAGGVLLVAPALLVFFATRPAENSLASAMLTGVRASVMLCGLCAAAAAAALGGVRPTHSLAPSLALYAAICDAATGVILVAWIGSWRLARERATALRRRLWGDKHQPILWLWVAGGICLLAAGLALAVNHDWFNLDSAHGLTASFALAIGAGALLLIAGRRRRDLPSDSIAPLGADAALITTTAGGIVGVLALNTNLRWPLHVVMWAALAVALVTLVGAVANTLAPLAAAPHDADYQDWQARWERVENLGDYTPTQDATETAEQPHHDSPEAEE